MTLQDLYKMVEKDLNINDTELDRESLRTPYLHDKYLKFYETAKLELARVKKEYKKLRLKKILYYSGKAEKEVYDENPFEFKVLKNELDVWLDADDELEDLNLKVEFENAKVDYLQRTLTEITRRSFHIKSAIDWRKFINGIS